LYQSGEKENFADALPARSNVSPAGRVVDRCLLDPAATQTHTLTLPHGSPVCVQDPPPLRTPPPRAMFAHCCSGRRCPGARPPAPAPRVVLLHVPHSAPTAPQPPPAPRTPKGWSPPRPPCLATAEPVQNNRLGPACSPGGRGPRRRRRGPPVALQRPAPHRGQGPSSSTSL